MMPKEHFLSTWVLTFILEFKTGLIFFAYIPFMNSIFAEHSKCRENGRSLSISDRHTETALENTTNGMHEYCTEDL